MSHMYICEKEINTSNQYFGTEDAFLLFLKKDQ